MNIFVASSSRNTNNNHYLEVADAVGNFIVEGKHNYIFGASNSGIMGRIYSIVSKSSNSKIGISTVELWKEELENLKYDFGQIAPNTARRKEELLNMADIIVVLPGGPGTIEEMISAIETKRSKEHNKTIIIANIDNYFEPVFEMIRKTVEEGFASESVFDLYVVANTTQELIEILSKQK